MNKRLFPLLLLLVLGACCGPSGKLVIISTNDIHSSIDNFPSLATLVSDYRSQGGAAVLVVDAGDRWSGSPYVDMAPEQYKPVIDLMNAVGYDIATYGNHEWDNGINLLAKRMGEAGWVNVLSNAAVAGSGLDMTVPYYITEVDGLKIGFIGLVTTDVNGHPDGKLENFGTMEFYDPFETADRYAGLADSVDLYIAVTHFGFDADSLLALRRPELDLIIGGHSHHVIPEGREIGGTVVTQTGKSLVYAGITEITYRNGKVKKIDNRLVQLDTVARRADVAAVVDSIKSDPDLIRPVGATLEQMDKIALVNLFSDAMREIMRADFAFYNMGGMRLSELPAGIITRADVYSAEPFGNTIVSVMMTMDDIAEFILNKFNSSGKESHTLDLYPSGMTYRIVTDGEENATDIFFDHDRTGTPDGKFLVVMSDYVDSVYQYPYTGQGNDSQIRIASAADWYITRNSPIEPDDRLRVSIE